MPDALFVAVEGIDASGKTTLIAALASALRTDGILVATCREPSHGLVGAFFREVNTKTKMSPMALALLSSADRHDQQQPLARLRRGNRVILADRYYLSGLAYHSVDGIAPGFYQLLNKQVAKPDAYLYLDVAPGVAATRRARGPDSHWEQRNFAVHLPAAYEDSLALVTRTEAANVIRLDAGQPPQSVLAAARRALTGLRHVC
jgi:dTMP kinase